MLEQKSVLENSPYSRHEIPNDPQNKSLTHDELENIIAKLKTKKYMGWKIANEVINNKSVTSLLLKFVQKCFDSSLVPSIWLKVDYYPYPKECTKRSIYSTELPWHQFIIMCIKSILIYNR